MFKLLLPFTLAIAACSSTPATQEVRPYPLDTCVVMGSKLGSMGDPVVRVYNGQEIKFCCDPCVEEFEADPEYYLEKLPQD